MLKACELSKSYGQNRALDALNLTVEPGEIFCLLSVNGAGKTTTIQKTILRNIRINSGKIVRGLTVQRSFIAWLSYLPELQLG